MAKGTNVEVTLKNVRLSFENVFREQVMVDKETGKTTKKFKANFLIDKSNKALINEIDDAIDEVIAAKWPSNPPKIKDEKLCMRDGDDENYDGYAGTMYVSASNSKRPTVVGRDKQPLVEADGIIYSGCYVNAVIRIWAQDNEYGKRVNASLEAVQFYKKGDAFGAPPVDIDEKFETYEDEEDGDSRSDRGGSRRSRDEDDRGSRRSREDSDDRGSRRSRDESDDRGSRRSRDDSNNDDDGQRRRRRS